MFLTLDDNVLCVIFGFLKNQQLYNLKKIMSHNLIEAFIEENRKVMRGAILNLRYYTYFGKSFINYNLIKQLPMIKFQKRFIGLDYIDGISARDMKQPIMVGRDNYKRPFISIKYRCNDKKIENKYDDLNINNIKTYVITIFQRYTGIPSTWCKAGCYQPLLWDTSTNLRKNDKKLLNINITKLLENEKTYYIYDPDSTDDIMSLREMDCYLV